MKTDITLSEDSMANDRDNELESGREGSSRDEQTRSGKRVIGKGMTSPDSTQVPLKAETGEPDYDAINGRIPSDQKDEGQSR